MLRHAAALSVLLVAAPAAFAQASDEIIRETAGEHQLVPTDGKPVCTVALTPVRIAPDTYRATPRACPGIPALARVTSWRLLDGTTLLDARGNTVMHFVEDETALPSYPDLQRPLFYLVPEMPGFTHLPRHDEWAGAWKLKRQGKPICTITLSTTRNGTGDDTRKLSAASCSRQSPASRLRVWELDGMQLMLWGPNDQQIALEYASPGRWTGGGWTLSK